jgi:multidrug resistance protein MdtO
VPARVERAWAALRANDPGRLAFALRLTLACCVTALIALWFAIPEPALTVYLVLFLNRPERTTSILLAAVMLGFVSLLIALLFPLVGLLADAPFWRVLAMAALSFGLVWLGSASRLRPFASSTALVTAYVLDLLGSLPAGELATRGLLYAWLFVAVPAGVSVVVALALAPDPGRQAGALLARALDAAADLLDLSGKARRGRVQTARRKLLLGMPGLLKASQIERTLPPTHADALRSATAMTMRILAAIDLIDRHPDAAARAALAAAVAPTLRAMAAILEAGGYPVAITDPCWPVAIPDDLARLIATLSDALAGFATTPLPPAEASPRSHGVFATDAFTNPVHVRHAVKVTLAAMSCYVLYALWDWPGIHTAMITCYIVALGTAAETVEKLSLRIVGCIAGAALGLAAILFVLPSISAITGLLLVVAGGMLLACWVAAGDARISYAGFQIGFAFLLCVLQGSAPGFDLVVARDRVIGVLLGTMVSYAVFTRIWPVPVSGAIDPAIARLLALMRRSANASAGARQALLTKAMAASDELGHWLDLAAFEPVSLRPADDWIAARRRLLARVERMESPLLLDRPA